MPRGQFVKSAVLVEDYPVADRPELALVGRSNAGKSTFLNALCSQKIAKVSAHPGKTRLMNFFNIGDFYRIVDMPGYGYAARSKSERKAWGKMIENFLFQRENLKGLMLICDMRRSWTEDETLLLELAKRQNLNFLCILTKADKLNRKQLNEQLKKWLKTSALDANHFQVVSGLKRTGVQELEKYIFSKWIRT